MVVTIRWSEMRGLGSEEAEPFLMEAEAAAGGVQVAERSSYESRWYRASELPQHQLVIEFALEHLRNLAFPAGQPLRCSLPPTPEVIAALGRPQPIEILVEVS